MLATALLLATLSASGYSAPHEAAGTPPRTLQLGGRTYVDKGLVAAGRLPAGTVDFLGDTLGSFSSLAVQPGTWKRTASGYEGVLWTLPDRGRNDPEAGVFYDYAGRVERMQLRIDVTRGKPGALGTLTMVPDKGVVLKDFNGQPFTGADPGEHTITQRDVVLPSPASGAGAGKVSLDAESLQFTADGHFYIGDEYTANVYYFDAQGQLYPPELLAETLRIAERCHFTLEQLQYTYPRELVPEGHDPDSWLRVLVERGIPWRWKDGIKPAQRTQVEHELALIRQKNYASYFLTVQDIVRFARSQGILCQGRGSAANSAVCFVLGVTEIDPARSNLLFERFISAERDEPPDIDIDFEHERREEVLQYVFKRYGRERAALTAVAISYRGRSAIRDVARALGLPMDQVNELGAAMDHWGGHVPLPETLRERGFDPETPLMRRLLALTAELIDFPRHLSQHPGGFVISEHPLSTLVPVENAAMADRTVIQWDKDDLDATGLMKVDCLALGMLTAIRKCLAMLQQHGLHSGRMDTIPDGDTPTYDMISAADTIGVFQIESRAQMAMLPRMQPRNFYDLVIEVAIVRPGPIQGDMVHPYLERRRLLREQGPEALDNLEEPLYPPQLERVFARTLGVPLFQEQVMQLAVDAAGYTPGEADALRRSMAAWKRRGGLEPHREKLLSGMLKNGFSREYGEHLFEQIKGFGDYGFPESHAASFALLTYASCWLKCHHPAAFTASLINSQPLGFYSPDQLLQDARRHGIGVLPVDVRHSDWDCTLDFSKGAAAIRLGLRLVDGCNEPAVQAIMRERARRPFDDVGDLCQRTALDRRQQGLLADAGALRGLSGHRHRARWDISGVENRLPLFDQARATAEARVPLPLPSAWEDMQADYRSTGTTLGRHPISFLRAQLRSRGCLDAAQLAGHGHGRRVRIAGLVRMRQRPQTASGVTFLTLEDETGMVNAVVWRHLADRQHRVLVDTQLMQIDGRLERVDGVQHVIVQRMHCLDELLQGLRSHSRDFH